MRRSRAATEATRARIVAAAARRIRRDGAAGVAIAGLMRGLGRTQGGFYRHFDSRDQLVEEALEAATLEMAARLAGIAAAAPAGQAHRAIVTAYLSDEHCDSPERGCPLAALGPEIGRLPRRSRDVCQRLLAEYAERMARYLPGADVETRERRATALFSAMAGTVTLARTIRDRARRRRLLDDAGRYHVAGLEAVAASPAADRAS